jgi:hypothetical protein
VDVFYLTDLSGAKIENPLRLKALQTSLLKAAAEPPVLPMRSLGRGTERSVVEG